MGVTRLAVDAMGGDYAPREIVAGALQGARELGVSLTLVGDPEAVRRELAGFPTGDLALDVTPASDLVRMDEDPVQAVRERPEASINVACRLVLEGRADGVLTMGHTGAGMIAALRNFGTVPGVERPAVIVPFLDLSRDLYLLDAGANIVVRPRHLLQFARMGVAYARYAGGVASPRVGLLSNGSEANKGGKVGKAAYSLLAAAEDLDFVGNVEGHTLLADGVNVVVCDGFVGNVLFKGAQGVIPAVLAQVAEVLPQLPPEAAATLRAHLDEVSARNHYARYGAAALLGVQHPIFIGHGRSKAWAVQNGMAAASRMIAADVVGRIWQTFAAESLA